MNVKNLFRFILTVIAVSFLTTACGDDKASTGTSASQGSDAGGSSASSALSHDVVYEDEIYKNWPK